MLIGASRSPPRRSRQAKIQRPAPPRPVVQLAVGVERIGLAGRRFIGRGGVGKPHQRAVAQLEERILPHFCRDCERSSGYATGPAGV